MDAITLTPERRHELQAYARERGQDLTAALDELVAAYLEWSRQGIEEATQGIQPGYEDVLAGRTRPANELLEELSRKNGFPR